MCFNETNYAKQTQFQAHTQPSPKPAANWLLPTSGIRRVKKQSQFAVTLCVVKASEGVDYDRDARCRTRENKPDSKPNATRLAGDRSMVPGKAGVFSESWFADEVPEYPNSGRCLSRVFSFHPRTGLSLRTVATTVLGG